MVRKILAIKPTVSKQVFIEMQLYRAYFSGGVLYRWAACLHILWRFQDVF